MVKSLLVIAFSSMFLFACREDKSQENSGNTGMSHSVRPDAALEWTTECDQVIEVDFSFEIRRLNELNEINREMNEELSTDDGKADMTNEEKEYLVKLREHKKKMTIILNEFLDEYETKVKEREKNNKVIAISHENKSAYCMRMPYRADPFQEHHGRYVRTRDGAHVSYALWVLSTDPAMRGYGKIDYRAVYQAIDPVFEKKYEYRDIGDERKLSELTQDVVGAFREVVKMHGLHALKDVRYHLAIEKRKEKIGAGSNM